MYRVCTNDWVMCDFLINSVVVCVYWVGWWRDQECMGGSGWIDRLQEMGKGINPLPVGFEPAISRIGV